MKKGEKTSDHPRICNDERDEEEEDATVDVEDAVRDHGHDL